MTKIDTLIQQFAQDIRQAIIQDIMGNMSSAVTANGVKGKLRMVPMGGKRKPEELAKVSEQILGLLKKTPGMRSEEMQRALVVNAETLALPLKQLAAKKLIRHEGVARGRKYSLR